MAPLLSLNQLSLDNLTCNSSKVTIGLNLHVAVITGAMGVHDS